MAYVREAKHNRVAFEAPHRLAGLTILTKAVNVRTMATFAGLFAEMNNLHILGNSTTDQDIQIKSLTRVSDVIDEMRELFAGYLIEWDMQSKEGDEIVDVPPTVEGLKVLDDDECITLIEDWMEGLSGVAAPLENPSNSGETSLEQSIPMEIESQSLAS